MDQYPVDINIDGYWNSQIHALLILSPYLFLLYKCRNGEVIFAWSCFPDV